MRPLIVVIDMIALVTFFLYTQSMGEVKKISDIKKRGRGRPRTDSVSIHMTMTPTQIAELDVWIAKQDDEPSRQEAIRRLLADALKDR